MMLGMSMSSLTFGSASSDQSKDFGRKRRNRYALRASSASVLMATVLLWSGAGAADLGEADIEETAPAAAVEWSEVDTAPQAAPAPRSRLEQLMAEQAEGAARGSAPAVVRAEASPASAAASRAPIMPIIKKAVVERPAPAPGEAA